MCCIHPVNIFPQAMLGTWLDTIGVSMGALGNPSCLSYFLCTVKSGSCCRPLLQLCARVQLSSESGLGRLGSNSTCYWISSAQLMICFLEICMESKDPGLVLVLWFLFVCLFVLFFVCVVFLFFSIGLVAEYVCTNNSVSPTVCTHKASLYIMPP